MRREWHYYDDFHNGTDGIEPLLLLLVVGFIIFLMGVSAGKTREHERQRRLGKIKGRINSIDPAEVTDYRLSTIEDVLPKE